MLILRSTIPPRRQCHQAINSIVAEQYSMVVRTLIDYCYMNNSSATIIASGLRYLFYLECKEFPNLLHQRDNVILLQKKTGSYLHESKPSHTLGSFLAW